MAQNTVEIKFIGDSKALRTAIEKLDKATKSLINTQGKLENQGKKVIDNQKKVKKGVFDLADSNRMLGGTFAVLRSKMLLFNFAMGLGIRQLGKLVNEASRVQAMETAFNTLTGATENSSVALMKLRNATDNTMSSFDLFQQANNAMILGVTKNSDEMAEMFDVAQRLGRALGRDTASSVESLITGIGRQSRLMLDNIGIIVKSEEAYESFAKANNTTADALTDTQKKQAFLEATMESARKKVQTLGNEHLTTKDSFDQLKASSADLATELGNTLSPVFNRLSKNTTSLFSTVTQLLKIVNHTTTATFNYAKAQDDADKTIAKFSKTLPLIINSSAPVINQLRSLQRETKLMSSDYREIGGVIRRLKETQTAYNKELQKQEGLEAVKERIANEKQLSELKQHFIAIEQQAFQKSTENQSQRNAEQQEQQKAQEEAYKKHIHTKTMMDDAYFDGLKMASKDANDEMKSMLKDLANANTAFFDGFTMAQTEAGKELKAMQDEMQEQNEQLMSNIDLSISSLDKFLSSWQSNMQARMDAEISTLKDSEAYKSADTERRKDMERRITQGYKDEQLKQFRIGQATALADIAMSTSSALMKSVAGSWVTIGQPWFSIIAGLGVLQAGQVLSQKPPSFEQGGLVGGNRHSQGGTMIEAERGEFVMSRRAVESIGVEAMNNINQGQGTPSINLNISAPLVDETVVDTLIPAIQSALSEQRATLNT